MAVAPPLTDLRVQPRLRLQIRYMCIVCGELLTGGDASPLFNAAARVPSPDAKGIENWLKQSKQTDDEALWAAETALRPFHQQCVALAPKLSPASERENAYYDALYESWSWQKATGWGDPLPRFETATRAGTLLCHHVLLLELADWAMGKRQSFSLASITRPFTHGSLKKDLPRWRKNAQKLRRSIRDECLTSGDMVSHLMLLLGMYWLGAGRIVARSSSTPGDQMVQLLESVSQESRQTLLELLVRNDVAVAALPELAAVLKGVRPDARDPLMLVPKVQKQLRQIQRFSDQLVRPHGQVTAGRAIVMGTIAQQETGKFAALASPLLAADEVRALTRAVADELGKAEDKFFHATVLPRPALYDQFIRWARQRLVLFEGAHFPLSQSCLHTVVLCHNLLALEQAKGPSQRDEARRGVKSRLKKLLALQQTSGDMFAIHLAVEGLRRTLAQRRLQDANAGWEPLLPKLSPELVEPLLEMAGLSPLVRLTVPEMEAELQRNKVGWRALEQFLDDPQAEPLRDFAAGELMCRVIDQPKLMCGSGGRVLDACLHSKTLGGVLFAAEFLHALLHNVFSRCEDLAEATSDKNAGKVSKNFLKRMGEFAAWFFDIGPRRDGTVPAAVFGRLADLLACQSEVRRRQANQDDPRLRLLGQHWRGISLLATRGLRQRLWRRGPKRLLRMFWLNFCIIAFERIDEISSGLDSGEPRLDDLETFGCTLAAHLHRSLRAYKLRMKLEQEIDAREQQSQAGREVSRREESLVKDEFAVIRDRLNELKEVPRFRTALIIRRLLVKKGKNSLVWNVDRIDEVAAADMAHEAPER